MAQAIQALAKGPGYQQFNRAGLMLACFAICTNTLSQNLCAALADSCLHQIVQGAMAPANIASFTGLGQMDPVSDLPFYSSEALNGRAG